MADIYKRVQFFGYEVNTFPEKINWQADPLVPNKYWLDQKYHANADAVKDMTVRCQLMDEAVQAAVNASFCNHDADCLKIFVAPEFYFRGERGGYEFNQVSDILIPALQGMVSEKNFQHWLFVFGSMIGYSEIDKSTTTKRDGKVVPLVRKDPTPKETHEVYNLVLVQTGGSTGIEGSRITMKEFKSGIDFLSRVEKRSGIEIHDRTPGTKLLHEDVRHLGAGKRIGNTSRFDPNRGHGKELSARTDSGLGIFEHGGIMIGVEVCLDHAMSRLRRSPPAAGQQKVRLHIITSAGMRIKPGSVVAKLGGFAFNCDGAGYQQPSMLMQVTAECKLGGDASLNNITNAKREKNPITLHTAVEAKKNFTACFPQWKSGAKLVGYNPLPLPKASFVTADEAKTSHWVADSARDWCNFCGSKFSFSHRRHHCRVCGELICSNCSREKTVKGIGINVRVCKECNQMAERDRPL